MKCLYKVSFSRGIKIAKIEAIAPESAYRDSMSWAGNFYRETFDEAHRELCRRLINRKTHLQDALARNEERYQFALTLKDDDKEPARTCETCGDNEDCSVRHMLCEVGCKDWTPNKEER